MGHRKAQDAAYSWMGVQSYRFQRNIITALNLNNDFEIIAFDAPGNGSSEGDLSNLLLFIEAIKSIVVNYDKPEIVIGHSLGALVNVIAFKELGIKPSLLISLTPLLQVKENFEASMNTIGVPASAQTKFLYSFEKKVWRSNITLPTGKLV